MVLMRNKKNYHQILPRESVLIRSKIQNVGKACRHAGAITAVKCGMDHTASRDAVWSLLMACTVIAVQSSFTEHLQI